MNSNSEHPESLFGAPTCWPNSIVHFTGTTKPDSQNLQSALPRLVFHFATYLGIKLTFVNSAEIAL